MLEKVRQCCENGRRDQLPDSYKQVFNEISVKDGLLMRGSRTLIPSSLQQEVLEQIHSGHQGMIKCKERARRVVWWPGMTSQIEEKICKCKICCPYQRAKVEPLLPSSLPELPWQKLVQIYLFGTFLIFTCNRLLLTFYRSRRTIVS